MSAVGLISGTAPNKQHVFRFGAPKAHLRSALAPVAPRPSINNTVDGLIGFSVDGFTEAGRASESKITSRHLPHGSGDVGLHANAGPVHEVQEGLALHPR